MLGTFGLKNNHAMTALRRFLLPLLSVPAITGILAQNLPDTLSAQDPATLLAPATVISTRLKTNELTAPYSLSTLSLPATQNGRQMLSPQEFLPAVPGVFSLNADNFAQDLRISIRGFGARSAFGIRGLRLMVDDLPESTPDGQGQVDNLALGLVERVEVVRGPAAGLYGNASGGVVAFYTEDPAGRPYAALRMSAGSFGFQQYQSKFGGQRGRFQHLSHAAWTQTDGYRDHSGMRAALFYGKYRYTFGDRTTATLIVNYANSPQADDAGALTLLQADMVRRSARDLNLRYQAGERLWQGRAGVVFDHRFSEKSRLKIRVFHTLRDFENKLPTAMSGIVALQRGYAGGGANWTHEHSLGSLTWQTQLGFDLDAQRDDRQRYNNEDGARRALVFDQRETFRNAGAFWLNQLSLREKISLTANLRFDAVQLRAADYFTSDGDDSDTRTLRNLSPILGLNWLISPNIAVYGNIATSFETPALTELSANPSGRGGFNPDLSQQRALSAEVGLKGLIFRKLRFEVALFRTQARSEFVPFELDSLPGRTFYRNAGRSLRRGLEAAATWRPVAAFTMTANCTATIFRYEDYQVGASDFKEKSLPGLPNFTAFIEPRWQHRRGSYVAAQIVHSGRFFADDANTERIAPYTLLNLRGGWLFTFSNMQVEPFAGLNNVGGSRYFSNVRLNAVGRRYYEPGAGLGWYGGIRLRI